VRACGRAPGFATREKTDATVVRTSAGRRGPDRRRGDWAALDPGPCFGRRPPAALGRGAWPGQSVATGRCGVAVTRTVGDAELRTRRRRQAADHPRRECSPSANRAQLGKPRWLFPRYLATATARSERRPDRQRRVYRASG